MKKDSRPEWKVLIDLLAQIDDAMFNRIIRRMIYYLYSQQVKEIDKLMSSLEPSYATAQEAADDLYVNVPRPKRTRELLAEIADRVFEIAGKTLPDEEIAENIRVWMTQERTRFFTSSFKNRNISLIKAIDEITRFFNIPRSEIIISPEEFISIR